MTNLWLSITLATNLYTVKLESNNTTNTHLYSIWQTDDIGMPITNWDRNIIFQGGNNGTNTIYAHNVDTNRFYILVDEGDLY